MYLCVWLEVGVEGRGGGGKGGLTGLLVGKFQEVTCCEWLQECRFSGSS